MSAMIYVNGAWQEADTPKRWNGSAFEDTDGYYWENGTQKEAWNAFDGVMYSPESKYNKLQSKWIKTPSDASWEFTSSYLYLPYTYNTSTSILFYLNITKYNSFKVDVYCNVHNTDKSRQASVVKSGTGLNDTHIKQLVFTHNVRNTYTVDISTLSGNYYLGLFSWGDVEIDAYKIWVE